MRSRWLLLAAAASVICLAIVLGRGTASEGASPAPVTLRVAYGSLPDAIDPQLSFTNEGWTAMYNTYVPLLTFRHAKGRAGADVVPGLARGLPRITDGGRTYTLFLRRGLRYSNGMPVRASDFEFAIKRLFKLSSGGTSYYSAIVGTRRFQRGRRGGISGITANNRSGRIVIRLRRPWGAFIQVLAMPFAAPVPPGTPMRDRTFKPPPATGPYVITDVSGKRWTYERNPAWGSRNGGLMPELPDGHADRIEVRVIRSIEARVEGVLGGRIDWINDLLPPAQANDLRSRYQGSRYRVEPLLTTEYFWMNTTRPPFNDPRVREAANYAVDRSVLQKIYGGQLIPSQQILPPGMPGYQELALFPYDLAKARQLIAEAAPVDRRVTVWTDTEPMRRGAAAYYRSQLQKIGLEPRFEAVGAAGYFSVIGDRMTPDRDTGWASWYADHPHPDGFFRPLLHGSSIQRFFSGNFSRIDVPDLNAEIERLSRRPLDPEREDRYSALDRSYMELAPLVPYGNLAPSTLVSGRVDLDRVIWNPLFGADLTSFRFR